MKQMFELFLTFAKIGLFTIGGGYAMIPLIKETVVDKKQWTTEEDLMDLIAVAQSCPGVFAINISVFIGYRMRRLPGALMCALGAALPSFIIILAIAMFFRQFKDNPTVASIFRGIRPAVVALIAVPVFKMARTSKINIYNSWIPIVSALCIWLIGVSPIYIILIAAIGGYTYRHLLK
ncbi:MAG: chromate transporter [Bacteroidaceae bacterium]|nr:chromate transporter [Bacteroidaceae bacterium]